MVSPRFRPPVGPAFWRCCTSTGGVRKVTRRAEAQRRRRFSALTFLARRLAVAAVSILSPHDFRMTGVGKTELAPLLKMRSPDTRALEWKI